jgi:DNA-binding CsgD family transcriptional regulator
MELLKPITTEKFIENAKNQGELGINGYEVYFEKQIKDAETFAISKYFWFIGDNTNMKIMTVSDTVNDLTPFPKEKWEGASPYFFAENMHPEDMPFTLAAISLAVSKLEELTQERRSKVRINIYTRMINKKNEYRWVLIQMPGFYSHKETLANCAMMLITDLSHFDFKTRPIMMTFTDLNENEGQSYNIPDDEMKLVAIDLPKLTQREREVLQLMIKGLNSPQISEKLFLSYHTVENHKRNMRKKTQSKTTAELIDCVWRNNMF